MIVWKKTFQHLTNKQIPTYPPQTKTGEATEMYVVLKLGLTAKAGQVSSSQNLYDVLIYTPRHQYSKIQDNVETVKNALAELRPMLIPTYFESEPFFDESVQAWMVSIQYKNFKKLPHKAERRT